MSDADLFTTWYMSLGLATVLIVVAAALLIAVLLYARRILKLAVAALGLVEQIKENTNGIWELENTNATATDILSEANSIRDHAGGVVKALHETEFNR